VGREGVRKLGRSSTAGAVQGYDLLAIPYVLQLNKRDLSNVASVDEMVKQLRKKGEPVFEAEALKGTGVFETLKGVAKLVLQELTKTG
jgi:hypothetical protein